MIEILHDRWYIEDQIRPSLGRKVHFIVDLYTDESILKLPLVKEMENLLELNIYGVNLGRELTYIERDDHIILDLGNLNSWTSVKNSQGLIKVRLDFKFIIIDPSFDLSSIDLGYRAFFEVYGYKLDKGSISAPLGMKIDNNGTIEVETFMKCGKGDEKFKENLKPDYVDVHHKRKRYNFTVKGDVKEIIDSEECETKFKVFYRVVNEKKYFIVPIVGFALLILAISRFFTMISGGEMKFDIRYLAAAVAFLGLILNFVRNDYELPFRRLILISVMVLIVEMALELIFLVHG